MLNTDTDKVDTKSQIKQKNYKLKLVQVPSLNTDTQDVHNVWWIKYDNGSGSIIKIGSFISKFLVIVFGPDNFNLLLNPQNIIKKEKEKKNQWAHWFYLQRRMTKGAY